jgi:antitoxin VapB
VGLRVERFGIYFGIYRLSEGKMQKTAKLFMNNRSQAVRLPKEFQFKAKEVYIRKVGDEIVLSPRPGSMAEYVANRIPVSDEFVKIIEDLEDLPLKERAFV